jgi:hypothetical protein
MNSIDAVFDAIVQAGSSTTAGSSLLPLQKVPDALKALDLDPDDDFVLDIFKECAEPLQSSSSGRTHNKVEQGVPREQFRKVCDVLLSDKAGKQQTEPPARRRKGLAHDDGSDADRDEELGQLSNDSGDDKDGSYQDDESSVAAEDDEDFIDPEENLPSRSKKVASSAQQRQASSVMKLFVESKGQSASSNAVAAARMSSADLIEIAAKVGEKLAPKDAEEMIEEALRLHTSSGKKGRANTIGVDE